MKLALNFGYWSQGPPPGLVEQAQAADALGYDSVWVAETWGSEAFVFSTWLAAHTERVKIGTGIAQIAARTPTATAMAASTLDHLSGGRVILGLGVSGPQVVEGWYGRPSARPLARTREYVEIVRRTLRRDEPVTSAGDHYPLPYTGPGSQGLGKPLVLMTQPLRADLPIFLGAEGPKNVAQTVAIADGWLPLYYSPFRPEVYAEQLAGASPGFEVYAPVALTVADDVAAALAPVKAMLTFYVGGMGAPGQNFHTALMARMGYPDAATRVQELFLAGRRDEARAAMPDDFADEISLVGPPSRIKQRLGAWESSPVTTLLVSARDNAQMAAIRDIVHG
jgi:F420-dependent oxidoreductase-like protein